MDFGQALQLLKMGNRMGRVAWAGKKQWLSYSPGVEACPAENFWSACNKAFAETKGGKAKVLPAITMKTEDGAIMMGWTPSQVDMFADDWMIV